MCLFLYSGAFLYLKAQINLSHSSPQSIFKQSDLFYLNIENNIGISSYVYMEIEISESNYGSIGNIRTEKFLLPVGSTILDPMSMVIASKQYAGFDFVLPLKHQGVFGSGEYKANISLKSATDNNTLSMIIVPFSVKQPQVASTENNTNTSEKKNSPAFKISTSGNAEVIGYYSIGQPSTSLMPPSYLQTYLNPQVSVFDVPVGANIFLTTQQNPGLQQMNYFRLNFDANNFRNMLMKRLKEMITKKVNLDKMNLSNFDSYKDQLTSVQNTLKNPGVIQEMAQIKELDSLKQQFNSYKDKLNVSDSSLTNYINVAKDSLTNTTDTSFNKLDSAKTSITDSIGTVKDSVMQYYEKLSAMYEKIQGMQWLEEKKQYYEQLTSQKDKILDYGKKIGCIDSLGNYTSQIEKFDASKYSDPSNLYSALRNNKLIKKYEKYLFWVKSVNIGMHSPVYSDLSLNGVSVNGFGIELEPYKFYMAFNYGEALRPVLTNNLVNASYKRNLWSFKMGYGRTQESHIHFNMMSATDDSLSVNPRDSLYLYNKLPQDNKVISVDFKLVLFKKKLSVTGEIAGSQTIRDLTYNSALFNLIPTPSNSQSNANNWFANIFSQQGSDMNVRVDYAVNAKVEGRFFEGSVISAIFARTGTNFQSFGLPFLIKDRMIGEFKASQKFWKNRISVSGFFRYNVDNLDSTKGLTTQFFNYGADLRLNIPKLPTLSVSYMPVTLQNDSAIMNMNILNANCFHMFQFRKFSLTGILNYVYQSSTQTNGTGNQFNLHNISLNTIYDLKVFSITNILTYMSNETVSAKTNTFISTLSTSFTLFKKWTNTIGGNVYVNENSVKGGGFYQTSLSLIKNLVFNVRLETNRFNTYLYLPGYQDYTQFLVRTSIQYKW